MKNKTYILVTLIFLSLYSSNISAQEKHNKLRNTPTKRLVKNIIKHYIDYKNISYKITAKFAMEDKKYKLNINCRLIKDSIIWINANHSTGIPVARIIITKDSVKFLNKIKKTYSINSNSTLTKFSDYNLSFNTLQAILTDELINWENNKNIIKAYKNYQSYKDSCSYHLQNLRKRKLKRIIKKNKTEKYIVHRLTINDHYKISSSSFDDYANHQNIKIDYSNYKISENGEIPTIMNLVLRNIDTKITIKLKIRKYKLNKKRLSFPFRIPKSYTLSLDSTKIKN